MKQPHIIIIGGGICGLSIAWELLKNNCTVSIYDKGDIGEGATNYSGGMLAGGIENEPSEAKLWDLTAYSQDLWCTYYPELEKESGLSIDYRNNGTMMVATNTDDMAQIEFLHAYQQKLGVDVDLLTARNISKLEPHLKTVGGMICRKDHQVDSRLLVKALIKAIKNRGGEIHTHSPVKSINSTNGTADGITLKDGTILKSDKVVLCGGVYSPTIKGINDIIPVRPLKGQMLSLQMDRQFPLLEYVVWTPKTYLIPKSDGSLLVGATVEEDGFNMDNTAGGIFALLEGAWRALPATEDLKIKHMWVAHRPTARDDCPILSPLSLSNAFVATGHHRNGILLTPATGKLMADLILDKDRSPFLDTFSLNRFK